MIGRMFVLLFVFICVVSAQFPESNPNAGLVRHFVSFEFLPNVTQEQQEQVMTTYFALKTECVNQTTGENYIVSFDGGYPNSHEGKDQNMNQGYIVTFASVADRDFFVGRPFHYPYDPFHDKFKAYVGPLLANVFVFDFSVLP